MAKRSDKVRTTMRRDGTLIYSVLVCSCGRSRKFSAIYHEQSQDVDRLFDPIDIINASIKSNGWFEQPAIEFDVCPRCAKRYPERRKKKRGNLKAEYPYMKEAEDDDDS